MTYKMKVAVVIAVAAIAVGISPAPAMADNLTVSLSNGGTTVTCADGASCDTNLMPGVITFTSQLGTVTLGLTGTGSGAPALSGTNLDLSYNFVGSGAGTYTVALSENDLSGSNLKWMVMDDGNQSSGMTTALNVYADGSNTLFGKGTTICSAPATSSGVVNMACTGNPFSSSSFSLTDSITLTVPTGTGMNASGDADIIPLPEPGSLTMLTSGLLALVMFRRQKM